MTFSPFYNGHSPGYRRYKACTRKKTFYTSQQAARAKRCANNKGKAIKSYYRCPYCHRYHLTSKDYDEQGL